MGDSTMENIKNGNGLPPLSSGSSTSQSGITTEQRTQKGITHETFSHNDGNDKNNNNKK